MSGSVEERLTLRGAVVISALVAWAAPSPAFAQYEAVPPPSAYVLENVTLIQGDGTQEEGVAVVVRRGVVEAFGPEITVPPDTRVLEGESLHVYPGLVDAFGRAPLEIPGPNRDDEVLSWDPPRDAQGFTPHRQAARFLSGHGGDLVEERRSGIVAQAVFPNLGLMPGQGSLLLHRQDADAPRDLVLRPSVGAAIQLQGASGAYPSTLFGVMAFLRQAFLDADHHGLRLAESQNGTSEGSPPAADEDYEVLRTIAAGDLPVYFRADGAEDVRRALALSDELGFEVVIVGGGEAWRAADELRDRGVTVVVSVDFPEPRDWDPDEDGDREEPDPSAERERERLEGIYRNAAVLREAGVEVALTSDRGAGDLRAGARKAVEYGLPEEEALRALTSVPAELVGAPELGRISTGGGATFIVTNGPLLDEETEIVYTFVAGFPEEGPGIEGAVDEDPVEGRRGVDARGGGDER